MHFKHAYYEQFTDMTLKKPLKNLLDIHFITGMSISLLGLPLGGISHQCKPVHLIQFENFKPMILVENGSKTLTTCLPVLCPFQENKEFNLTS